MSDRRIVRRYAWLPVLLVGWSWRWLRWYNAHERWTEDASGMAGARWIVERRTALIVGQRDSA